MSRPCDHLRRDVANRFNILKDAIICCGDKSGKLIP